MPTTRRTKGAVLAPVRDDPMPRRPRSRGTSVASSQRSNDDYHHIAPVVPAVINRLTYQNDELTAENQGLRKELEHQKSKRWTLRDRHLAEQLAEYHAQHPQQTENTPVQKDTENIKDSSTSRKETTPPPKTASTPISEKKVVQFSTTAISTTSATPATVPRWKQFLTSLGGFSPFPARTINTQRAESQSKPAQTNDSPLGKLPPNRKRPAPEQEQETPTKKTKTPEPEPEQSEPEPVQSSSRHLETISEQVESAPQDFAADTPTRPSHEMPPQSERPARKSEPEPTPRRRTIKDARALQLSRTSLPASGLRRWETPSKPKEPNADKRLARMQQIEKLKDEKKKMEEEIAKLAAEQEADGIDTRKRKRVKVDELAFIPHNQPGDADGTFRVPEWDSDDEMEVDEEVPIRQNVFSLNAEKQVSPVKQSTSAAKGALFKPAPPSAARPVMSTAKATLFQPAAQASVATPAAPSAKEPLFKPAPPVSTADTATPLPPKSLFFPAVSQPAISTPAQASPPKPTLARPTAAALPASKFTWPSVGARQLGDEWSEADKIAAGEKFARGFESWLAVGLQA